MKRIAFLTFSILCAVLVGSCGEENKQEPFRIVTLTFETNGGSAVNKIVSKANRVVPRPEDPKKEGYSLEGWFTDDALTRPFDFSLPVEQDYTLYAKWKEGLYAVTLDVRGGNPVPVQNVTYNRPMTAPDVTHPQGYTLKEWRDVEGKVYDESAPVKGEMTLYAIWNMPADLFAVSADGKCDGLKEQYKSTLEYVDIPEDLPGVTAPRLNTNAFLNDTEIVSVSLPADYTDIGGFAFNGCTNLKSLFAYGVETYQTTIFKDCGIEHLHIPGTARVVQDSFTYMLRLTDITIHEAPEASRDIPLDFQGSGYVFWESPNVERITFLRTTAPTSAGPGPLFSDVSKIVYVRVPAASLASYQSNWAATAIGSLMTGM